MTKTKTVLTMGKWSGRQGITRTFLSIVGTPEELVRIMGDRHQDVEAALAGTKPYQIGNPVPVVAPVQNPPVATTSMAQVTPSGTQSRPVMAGMKRKAEDESVDVFSD
jgi:hypothetical protein